MITNKGCGTAFLVLESAPESDIELTDPPSIKEFDSNFLRDFELNLVTLKQKYPDYAEIIDSFFESFKESTKTCKNIDEIYSELSDIFELNEHFFVDFSFIIWNSYIRNVEVITNIDSFMNYLCSTGKNKIIFLNSFESLEFSEKHTHLKLILNISDIIYTKYPSENISLDIETDNSCQLYVHSLFDFKGINHSGENGCHLKKKPLKE